MVGIDKSIILCDQYTKNKQLHKYPDTYYKKLEI